MSPRKPTSKDCILYNLINSLTDYPARYAKKFEGKVDCYKFDCAKAPRAKVWNDTSSLPTRSREAYKTV